MVNFWRRFMTQRGAFTYSSLYNKYGVDMYYQNIFGARWLIISIFSPGYVASLARMTFIWQGEAKQYVLVGNDMERYVHGCHPEYHCQYEWSLLQSNISNQNAVLNLVLRSHVTCSKIVRNVFQKKSQMNIRPPLHTKNVVGKKRIKFQHELHMVLTAQ